MMPAFGYFGAVNGACEDCALIAQALAVRHFWKQAPYRQT
jgi:hypothetical protein